ncbi:MAG: phosphate acyltransferase PlsX [Clostridia bacterium]|nr:phosphate acyltransferase PlsX [Clostridia bacterium]
MRIIVDAFGGDNAPAEIVKGAVQAAQSDGHTVVLTGRQDEILRVMREQQLPDAGIEIVDAPDVVDMHDEPKKILRELRRSSMAVGLDLLAEGKGDAFVSAGSTGALLMGATFLVKRIKGVSRPAIGTVLPTAAGPCLLLDCGANAECRPEMLVQFAQMGSVYMSQVIGDGKPVTVGLVNIGTEDTKGGSLQLESYALLRQQSGLDFIGNVEAREIPNGAAQVLVADGFTGNVILKLMEGTVGYLVGQIKDLFRAGLRTKLAYLLVKPGMAGFKKKLDVSEYGGAPLLGVSRPVIKAHGNSKAAAVRSAIRIAADFAASDAIATISRQMAPQEEG